MTGKKIGWRELFKLLPGGVFAAVAGAAAAIAVWTPLYPPLIRGRVNGDSLLMRNSHGRNGRSGLRGRRLALSVKG